MTLSDFSPEVKVTIVVPAARPPMANWRPSPASFSAITLAVLGLAILTCTRLLPLSPNVPLVAGISSLTRLKRRTTTEPVSPSTRSRADGSAVMRSSTSRLAGVRVLQPGSALARTATAKRPIVPALTRGDMERSAMGSVPGGVVRAGGPIRPTAAVEAPGGKEQPGGRRSPLSHRKSPQVTPPAAHPAPGSPLRSARLHFRRLRQDPRMAIAEGRTVPFTGPEQIDTAVLETFDYDGPEQEITTENGEFTAVCPHSGLPDFARLPTP